MFCANLRYFWGSVLCTEYVESATITNVRRLTFNESYMRSECSNSNDSLIDSSLGSFWVCLQALGFIKYKTYRLGCYNTTDYSLPYLKSCVAHFPLLLAILANLTQVLEEFSGTTLSLVIAHLLSI